MTVKLPSQGAGFKLIPSLIPPMGSLVMDIFLVFILAKRDRLFSRELVGGLLGYEERPWTELRKGKPITETWLAQQLRPYGVKPRTIRIGEQVAKGYVEEDFMDTFRRYIPKTEVDALKERTGEAAGEQPQPTEQSTVERTTREPDQKKTEAPPPPPDSGTSTE